MPAATATRSLAPSEQDQVDRVIAKYRGRPGELLGILEELQEQHPNKYLTEEVLAYVAARTAFFRAQVYSVATFYALFNLKPQGDHTVCICRGTACHTRGSRGLLERVKLQLGLHAHDDAGSADKVSSTTADRRFTVRTVACFGQCALAPVVEVDHRVLGHVNERVLEREVEALRKGGR
ncbi:MAG: NAD(P)H-dependent oxidoreductase subunit E, partial [Acidobacteria bacterium]|jgi:NADH-quinone oxidoreductase subunit E|nr:NAD(P)H-dependent oxidoreductase subunit E [Acidobacteriota bacterium]